MSTGEPGSKASIGFHGTVGSLPLPDLLQVQSMNRFSGLLAVSFDGSAGKIYFTDGEIVHAEAGGHDGEAALVEILGWPSGSFVLGPGAPARQSIEKRFQHLMLDCHKLLDDRRRGDQPLPSPVPAPAPPAPRSSRPEPRALLEQIRSIRGVQDWVRCGTDGRPLGDDRPQAEALAARAAYAGLNHGRPIGEALRLGPLLSVAVSNDREPFVLVQGGNTQLMLALAPGTLVASVEAQVRVLLTRPGGSR